MAQLTVLTANAYVVDELVAVLLSLTDDQLANSAVILPTKRLGRYLLARLAEAKGGLVPPEVTTIDGFVHQETVGHPTVDDLHIELLIETLIAEHDFEYLRQGFAHEIKQIFNDLITCDRENFVELLNKKLTTDQHLADRDIDKMQKKFSELELLLAEVKQQLTTDRLTSHFFAHQQALQQFQFDSNNFYRIYIAAFTSVKQDDEQFFQTLAGQDNVSFYLQEIPTSTTTNPTRDLLTKLNISWQSPPSITDRAEVAIVELSSPLAEVLYSLQNSQQLIDDGVSAKDIALIVTNDSHYLPHLLATIDRYNFSKNLALPIPLTLTTSGMFMQALANFCCQEYQVPATIDLSYHAWSDSQPDNEAINEINDIYARGIGKLQTLAKGEPSKQLLTKFTELSKRFSYGNFQQRLEQLQKLFTELLKKIPHNVYETTSIEAIQHFLNKLANSSLGKQKITTRDFWQFVQSKFLNLTLRRNGEPLAGVQILSLPEVRGMPFQHIFVLGCREGDFPKSLPRDVLLSDKLKKSIGLTSWQRLEAMEDVTFNSLLARPAKLTLCHSSETPSRFIEKLRYQRNLEPQTPPVLEKIFPTITDNYQQIISETQIDRHWFTEKAVSASSIGHFIRCPMHFLLRKSQIASRDFHRQRPPHEQGNMLHNIIDKFAGHPRYREACRRRDHKTLTELLDELSKDLTRDDRSLALHLRHYSWPRLAEFSQQKATASHWNEQREFEFEVDNETRWFPKPYRLFCRIDSIVTTYDYVLIVDYKSKMLPTSKEQQVSPQLPFYAYALEQYFIANGYPQRIGDMVVAYYSVLDGKLNVVAQGANVNAQLIKQQFAKKIYRPKKSLEQLIDEMHKLIAFRQQSLTERNFYPYADPSQCGTCQFDSICRKNDHRYRPTINDQKYLEKYLASRVQRNNVVR